MFLKVKVKDGGRKILQKVVKELKLTQNIIKKQLPTTTSARTKTTAPESN